MEKKRLIILLLVLALSFPASIFAETITLKSGKEIQGKISEDTKEYIKIETTNGESRYYYKNTIKIIKDDNGKITFSREQDYEAKKELHKEMESLQELANRYAKRWQNSMAHLRLAEKYMKKGDYSRSYQEYLKSNILGTTIINVFLGGLVLSGIITSCIFLIFRLFFKRKQREIEGILFRAKDIYTMLFVIFAMPTLMVFIILSLNYYFTDFFKLIHINPLVLSGLLSDILLLLICLAFLKRKYRLDNDTLGFVSRGYKFNVVLPIVLALVGILFLFLFTMLLNLKGIKPPQHPLEVLMDNVFTEGNLASITFFFLLVAVIAPISEEIIYRVFLLNFLKRYANLAFTVIMSAIIFALLHEYFIAMPYYFLLGIIFAITYVKTKTIIPSIVTHGLYNFVILLVVAIIKYKIFN